MTFGVDPAPLKDTVIWSESGPRSIAAADVPARMREIARDDAPLVAWDAPLSFTPGRFYHRDVDRVMTAWVGDSADRLERGAVSVQSFVGCPHWAITCAALGVPFGVSNDSSAWKLVEHAREISSPSLIEVHPAVALGLMWVQQDVQGPLPKYKQNPKACRDIAARLGLPISWRERDADDVLDAFVAYKLALAFRCDKARWIGTPARGGYVVMRSPLADELAAKIAAR